jgi:Na+/melibiose symporter-like transporter
MDYLGISKGLKLAYLLSASFGFVAISIRTLKLGETYKVKAKPKMSVLAYVKQSLLAGILATRKSNSIVKKLLLYVTLAGIGTGLTSPFVSIYVVDSLGINPFSYSLVVDIAGLTTVVLLFAVVVLIQRLGARNSTLLASVASPLANVVFTQSKTMDELLEWGVTGAVATALQTPSMATMQAETIPPEDRGKILAMFSILPALVSSPAQLFGGFLYTYEFPLSPFLLSILPFGMGALILYTARGDG